MIERYAYRWRGIEVERAGIVFGESGERDKRYRVCRARIINRFRLLIRGGILYRTYATHKNLYISLFLLIIFGINNIWSYLLWSPVITLWGLDGGKSTTL